MAGILNYKQIGYVAQFSDLAGVNADVGQLIMDMATQTTYQYNGTTWLPLGRVIVKKELNSVNAKTTGATLIYTLEASPLNFYPALIVPRATGPGVSGVTLNPTVSIGSNATAYDNIAASSLIGNVLTSLTGGKSLSTSTYSPPLAGGTAIYVNVTTGAIATNYTLKYDILGYYDV